MSKIKLYLDTNMVHDLFVNQANALKKGIEHNKPKKFTFLLENQEKFEFVTSFLTKAEIARELVSAHNIRPDVIEQFWTDFVSILKQKYIDKFEFDEQIVDIVYKAKMKLRTMVNFFHLFIAIREQAYFVSGDKPIINKAKEIGLYDKLLTYIELQKLAD